MSFKKVSFLGIALSAVLLTSLYQSKKFTDPFIVPKNFSFMFLGIIAVLMVILYYMPKKYKLNYKFNRIDVAVVLFYIYTLFNQLFLGVTKLAYDTKFLNLSMIIALYFLFKPFFRADNEINKDERFTRTVFIFIILLAIIQSVYALLQLAELLPNLQKEFKIGGSYGNPGPYANFLIGLFAYAFVFALYQKKGNLKYLAILSVILVLVILPLTKARTSWIAALVVMGFALLHHEVFIRLWNKYFSKLWSKVVLGIAIVGFITVGIVFLTSFKKDSASGRVFVWKVTADMIKDKPVFGHGVSSFAPVHNDYQAAYFEQHPTDYENAFLADGVNYAFNEYLQMTSDTGIVGLLLFLSIFFLVFYKKKIKPVSDEDKLMRLAPKKAILAILVSGLFSYPFQDPATLLLLFISVAAISANQEDAIYQFQNKKLFRQLGGVAGIIILVILFKMIVPRYKYEKEWIHAYHFMRQEKYEAADRIYRKIYPVMKYNQFFLFNYGAELTLMGKYEKSVQVLKEVEHRMNDADFYIYIGNSYESLGKLAEAEESFEKATNIMPVKFYPNYRLALLYQKKGNIKQARKYAQKIVDMPVKVESELIDNVKTEMSEFLKSTE